MNSTDAFVALNRFGMGARQRELAQVAGDPRGWLEDQLRRPPRLPAELEQFAAGSDHAARFSRPSRTSPCWARVSARSSAISM